MIPIFVAALVLDCDLDKIHHVGEWLHDGCKDDGCKNDGSTTIDPMRLQELELAVVEAVTNVIKHGNLAGAGQVIELELKRQDNTIEVIITDHGSPIPEAALVRSKTALDFDPADIANLPAHGLGLALIREATDGFDYRTADGVNTMRLAKNC